jgi:hypothetical protein
MRARWIPAALVVLAAFVVLAAGAMAQRASQSRRWAQYESEMQSPSLDPPDAWVETEFAFARLRFRSPMDYRGRFGGLRRWGVDSNKSERLFIEGLRRLTRVNARSVEEIVDVGSDEIYNWPWLYGVAIGDWDLTDEEIGRLRNYFERGGFFMVDDFHGEREWADFMNGITKIFDKSRVVEIQDDDQIFNVAFDLRNRFQVSGFQIVYGQPYERGGVVPHWRAVVDDKDRVQVAICFNMDLGDAWEFADYPPYPEKYSNMALRIGVNYVLYAMTH